MRGRNRERDVLVLEEAERPGQIIHEGEDYTIRDDGDRLLLEWKNDRYPSYESRRHVDNIFSVVTGEATSYRFNERDGWYKLCLHVIRETAEVLQEDSRTRTKKLLATIIDCLVGLLFVIPMMRFQLNLCNRDLSGGEFSDPVTITNVKSVCCPFRRLPQVINVEFVTNMLGVIKVDLPLGDGFVLPWPVTPMLTLHGDPSSVPDRTSLKYLAMRQIATEMVERREDKVFFDMCLKRVWGDFFNVAAAGAVAKRARESDGKEEEPEQKRARVDPEA